MSSKPEEVATRAPFVVVSDDGGLDPVRQAQTLADLGTARALLVDAGLWAPEVEPVIIVLDVVSSSLGLTLADAGTAYGPFSGRPAILLAQGAEVDPDVLLHELTHVWMRARGPRDEHGASEARWRLDGAHASHQSAMVHEGVADFIAAALTADPVIAERVLTYDATSLRALARCPEGLIGQPHRDALVVSGALWELGQGAMTEVVAAVATSAPHSASRVDVLVDGLAHTLAPHPTLGTRWADIVARRGLRRCDEPIPVVTRATSRADDFVAAGTRRFAEATEVTGPLTFRAELDGADAIQLTARSGRPSPPLEVQWRAEHLGVVVAEGRTPLEGWPSQFVRLPMPAADALVFSFVNVGVDDVAFNDVTITRHTSAPQDTSGFAAEAAGTTSCGCTAFGADGIGLALTLLWVRWRQRRLSATAREARPTSSHNPKRPPQPPPAQPPPPSKRPLSSLPGSVDTSGPTL